MQQTKQTAPNNWLVLWKKKKKRVARMVLRSTKTPKTNSNRNAKSGTNNKKKRKRTRTATPSPEELLANRFQIAVKRLKEQNPNATVRLATAHDLQQGQLLHKDTEAVMVTFVDPTDPVLQPVRGINDYEESLAPGDGVTNDTSSMGNLKDQNNRYASLAQLHHGRMREARASVLEGGPVWVVLQKGHGTGVKCLSLLLPNQKTDDGQPITLERCVVSCANAVTAAAAGEARCIDVASGMSHFLDAPPTADHLKHVRGFWERVNGTSALSNPDCFIVIVTPQNTGDNAVQVLCNGRWNTAPGKVKAATSQCLFFSLCKSLLTFFLFFLFQ